METSQIIWLVVGGLILIGRGIAYFTNKDYLKYANIFSPILNSALVVLQTVGGLMPDNTVIKTAVAVVSTAIEAAGYAEKLWLQGDIDKEKRPENAKEYITYTLAQADIEITDSLQAIIDGIIALTCYFMPHHSKDSE